MSTSRTKVLCFVPRGLGGRGGIERLFAYISRLENCPFDYKFVSTRGGGERPSHGAFLRAWLELFRAGVTRSIDLVHVNISVHGSAYRKVVLVETAKALGLKVVAHFHGGGFDTCIRDNTPWVRVNRHSLRRADAVVALGAYWTELFVDVVGVQRERVFTVYNAVPDFSAGETRGERATGPLKIAFAGEVGDRKGVDILVRALCELGKDLDWTCVIAGNGDATAYQEALASAGLAERMEFPGWVSSATIHDLMLAADVVVLPSRAEALPVSLIEGACAGAALVCTAAGASAEIVEDGVSGFVIPAEPAPLAAALRKLAGDRELLRRMRRAARKSYENKFTVGQMIAGLQDVYGFVLDPHALRRRGQDRPMTSKAA